MIYDNRVHMNCQYGQFKFGIICHTVVLVLVLLYDKMWHVACGMWPYWYYNIHIFIIPGTVGIFAVLSLKTGFQIKYPICP